MPEQRKPAKMPHPVDEKSTPLPPLEMPPVPSVPNRAHTEMKKTDAPCGNFAPGESDGNFTPEK